MAQMQAASKHAALVELVRWIDDQTAGLTLPTDERSQLAIGCLDVTLEHQAAIALLHSAELPGSMLALLRVLAESLVRGLWLCECATPEQLTKFKNDGLNKSFGSLIKEYETKIESPNGVLSRFKRSGWTQLNDFTHTGFRQVTRRHAPGKLGPNYPDADLSKALGVAGVLGLVAAGQLVAIAGRHDILPKFERKMSSYAKPAP